jgi:hypothetical protein
MIWLVRGARAALEADWLGFVLVSAVVGLYVGILILDHVRATHGRG